jgi:eukaryotic-like serine/threonine-protein kinase
MPRVACDRPPAPGANPFTLTKMHKAIKPVAPSSARRMREWVTIRAPGGQSRAVGQWYFVLCSRRPPPVSGSISAMLSVGEVFTGRYRVLARIAQGGMGVIYAAEHLATEERVALKVLFPQVLASKAAVESFQLEARMTARLGSEHVVRVLDAGFDHERNLPFLAMELLHGATLRSLVGKRGPLPAAQAIEVVRQMAKALDKAHGYVDRGGRPAPIVHRDLKPENIFVALREGAAIVKLLDFGIAKVLSESTEQSREIRGTPAFMACEQFVKGPVTPRLDVWALGLIVFYLLTGRKYWLAAATGGGDFAALLGEILAQPFDAPTERARALGGEPSWPRAFDEWFFRCVNRDLGARFASAGAAAAALEPALLPSARPIKAEARAARAALARLVVGLLSPTTDAKDPRESTGLSADDSALAVASAEVYSHSPPERALSGPWADASSPPPIDGLPSDVFAPTLLGPASSTVRDPEPPSPSMTAPAAVPPVVAFVPSAARSPSPSSATFDPTWSSTNSTKTLRLGTSASNAGGERGAWRGFRRPMLWTVAAGMALGCFGSLLAFSVLDGISEQRAGVASASAPLVALPEVAAANLDASPSSPPARVSAPPPSAPTPTRPFERPLVPALATLTPTVVPAPLAARKPPPPIASGGWVASGRLSAEGDQRSGAAMPKKAGPHEPSAEKQRTPQPDQQPEQGEVKNGEVTDQGSRPDSPLREASRSVPEGKVEVRPEAPKAPTAPAASPKSMYERP